jgi:iron complex transport system ATP-binding protein
VVVVLHDFLLAPRHCGRLVMMDGGRVVESGTPKDVVTESLVADVSRVRCSVHHHACFADIRVTGSAGGRISHPDS